jgi:hypothetical protein
METTVQSSNEYRNLPVAQLQECTTNPRRRFDEHSLAELAFSFQAQARRLRHQCASFRFPTHGRVRSQPNSRRLASRHFRDINDDSLRATPHLFHACL